MTRLLPLLAACAFAATATAQETPVPEGVAHDAAVQYSTARDGLVMDIYRPSQADAPLPAVVLIHGGGFRAGKRQRWIPLAIQLAQKGYVAATIDYGLAPQQPFPAAVEDSKTAVRFLRANAARFHVDPSRIAALGDSAGGHLALMLGVTGHTDAFVTSEYREQPSAVTCVVNYYGPTDLTKSCGKSVDACEVLPLFLGGDADHARARYILASPLNWVTPQAAPVLTLQGTKDTYVNYEHAGWITDRLKAAGVETELVSFEGAGHGFKGNDASEAERRALAFLDAHLKR